MVEPSVWDRGAGGAYGRARDGSVQEGSPSTAKGVRGVTPEIFLNFIRKTLHSGALMLLV
jgi:hypothetical protein